jgi:hypothetical protein
MDVMTIPHISTQVFARQGGPDEVISPAQRGLLFPGLGSPIRKLGLAA